MQLHKDITENFPKCKDFVYKEDHQRLLLYFNSWEDAFEAFVKGKYYLIPKLQ